eukprot:scaffold570922_cov47-Prasinocladus_malaysianus.AAC.1
MAIIKASGPATVTRRPKGVHKHDVLLLKEVHILLERCIRRHMSRAEALQVLDSLGYDAKFCDFVWSHMRRRHPKFFAAYEEALKRAKQQLELEDDACSSARR